MGERQQHQACVDAWLARNAKDLTSSQLIDLFNAASLALWDRTRTTLGEVTLTAIAARVLLVASERHPFLESLTISQTAGIQAPRLREHAVSGDGELLASGLRFVLVEWLTVLGNLTAQILTAELHAELESVTLKPAMAAKRAARGRKSRRRP